MAMSADRKLAAFSRPEMMVAQWEVDRGSEIRTVSIGKGPVGYAYALAFSPDGSILATTAEGPREQSTERSSIAIWDTRSGQRLRVLDARRSVEVRGLAFSPDGQTLISSGAEVNIWQVSNGRNLRTIKIPKWATATALSPDGQVLAWTGSGVGTRLLRIATGEELAAIPGDANGLAFSPDGAVLAIAQQRGIANG